MIFQRVSFSENQSRAYRILDGYGISRAGAFPIDPELVLRKMKIPFFPVPRLYQEHGIRGFLALYGGRPQVYIDEFHYDRHTDSAPFTLGEELGHFVLHAEAVEGIESVEDWFRVIVADAENYRKIEQQARLFSSNIMLPNPAFERGMIELVEENLSKLLQNESSSLEELAFNVASELAGSVGVSRWILEITLLRHPDRVAESIADRFPQLLGAKEAE